MIRGRGEGERTKRGLEEKHKMCTGAKSQFKN
jgi:hypothetical protein